MKHAIPLFLALVGLLFSVAPLQAAPTDFAYFSLDLPESWRASERENVLTLLASNSGCSISFYMGNSSPSGGYETAEAVAAILQGSTVKQVGEGFTFTARVGNEGVATLVRLAEKDSLFLLVAVTGESTKSHSILASMTSEDTSVQALIEQLPLMQNE